MVESDEKKDFGMREAFWKLDMMTKKKLRHMLVKGTVLFLYPLVCS